MWKRKDISKPLKIIVKYNFQAFFFWTCIAKWKNVSENVLFDDSFSTYQHLFDDNQHKRNNIWIYKSKFTLAASFQSLCLCFRSKIKQVSREYVHNCSQNIIKN